MIVYGTSTKELAKEIISDSCPECGKTNSIELYVFQKYAHVFWIPFFPTGKTAISQCEHCKQVLKPKEMPASLNLSYQNIKAQHRTPAWTFAGVTLVALIVAYSFYADGKKDEKNFVLIGTPQKGDIYEVKAGEAQYTLYKVEEIRGDSAILQAHSYETNSTKGLADLKRKGEDAFSEDLFSVSKTELKSMLKKGEILDIERN